MKESDAIREGDRVIVTRDDGREEIRRVRRDPWQLGNGTWVVGLSGISGGYALSRCRKIHDAAMIDLFAPTLIDETA